MEKKALGTLRAKLGCLYRWGAEGPDRFDCSGLIMWLLRTLGIGLKTDHTAAMMFNRFPKVTVPVPGVLAFLATKAGHVYHVMMVSKVEGGIVWCLGAHGGGSKTTSDAVA